MIRTITALALAAILSACATAPDAAPVDARAALAGAWTVDLSTDPATPYTKAMHLTLSPDSASGGAVTGDFYDSDILAGRWKTDRGRTCVSFRTTDGVGAYHTAACLVPDSTGGDRVEGQTWAEGRNFLFNWNAARAD